MKVLKMIMLLLTILVFVLQASAQGSSVVPGGEDDLSGVVPDLYNSKFYNLQTGMWIVGDFNDWKLPEDEESNGAIQLQEFIDPARPSFFSGEIPCETGKLFSFMVYHSDGVFGTGYLQFSAYKIGFIKPVPYQYLPFTISIERGEYNGNEYHSVNGLMEFYSDYDKAVENAKKIKFSVDSAKFYYVTRYGEKIQAFAPINVYVEDKNEEYIIDNTASIGGISADSDDSTAEFFDLTGRRVTNPEKGIFICRKGGQTSKVMIR